MLLESDKAKAQTKSYEWHSIILFPLFHGFAWWKNTKLSMMNQYKRGIVYATSVPNSFTSVRTSTLNSEKHFRRQRYVIFGQRNRQFPFFKADSKDSWNKLEQCKGWRLLHVLWQGTDILFHYDKLAWLND